MRGDNPKSVEVDGFHPLVIVCQADGTIRSVNWTVAAWTGRPAGDWSGQSCERLLAALQMPERGQKPLAEELVRGKGVASCPASCRGPEGRPYDVLVCQSLVQGQAGPNDSILMLWPLGPADSGRLPEKTGRDDSELERREEQLRTLVEALPDIVCFKDGEGRWLEANRFDLELFQLTGVDYRGKKDSELAEFSPFFREAFLACEASDEAAWQAGGISRGEETIRRPEGSPKIFDITKVPVFHPDGRRKGLVVFGRDVTQHKELEAQLLQSQKIEAIGRLAGGVAHDFNNLLTGILGFTEIGQSLVAPDEPLGECLAQIHGAAVRAASLTGQLLAFSRKQIIEPTTLDLGAKLGEMETLLRRVLGETIRLELQVAARAGLVRIDSAQLEQVVLNLSINGRDAMPQGGRLKLETAIVGPECPFLHRHPEAAAGEYVFLSVSDSGAGMDEETKNHLFEPFFTTKERGQGTGLGLATVYGIVKQNRGVIDVESDLGRGTIVRVLFPLQPGATESQEEAPLLPRPKRGGGETILIVEDEEIVCQLALTVLVQQGYNVLAAAGREEARQITADPSTPAIDLLLTDVILPDGNGRQVAEDVAAAFPEAKVVFTSGYTAEAIVHDQELDAGITFIPKPFTPLALLGKVRDVLDRQTG